MPYLSTSAVVIHYEEALYQVYAPLPLPDLDLLTLKVVSESRVTWATSAPILVFLGLSVLDLGRMYATDVRHQTCIIA